MFSLPEQITQMNKDAMDVAIRFANISMQSAEQLVKLQMDAAKQSLEENTKVASALASAKDVQELTSLRAKMSEAMVDKAVSYSRSVYEVASKTQSELTKLMEERLSGYQKDMASAMDKAASQAPAGSDAAMAAMKSTIAATTAAVDTMTKAAKQVTELANASVKAASNATADAVKGASRKATA